MGSLPEQDRDQRGEETEARNSILILVENLEGENKRIFEGIEQSVPRLTGCRCPLQSRF